jgi:hypothetical protein
MSSKALVNELEHQRAVAWVHSIVGVSLLVMSVWALVAVWWVGSPQDVHEQMIRISVVTIGSTLLPVGFLQAVGGWKLFQRKKWAGRTLIILVWGEVLGLLPMVGGGGLGYFLFPFFLGLAGYTTWVLLVDRKEIQITQV